MSKYPRIVLTGSLSAVKADLKKLKDHYVNDPYWSIANEPFQKVLQEATYTEDGEVDQPAVLSEAYYCNVILPVNHDFDLGTLKTLEK